MLLPVADGLDWSERLTGIRGVLLPGGGDVNPCHYGGNHHHPRLALVDDLQDEVDLSLIRHAIAAGLPLLAVCRGLQVLNVALGGSLVEDMATPHWREHREVTLPAAAAALGMGVGPVNVYCSHHQAIDRLAPSMTAVAWAGDGTIEAATAAAPAWTVGVQWHPEDTFREADRQVALMQQLVTAAGR